MRAGWLAIVLLVPGCLAPFAAPPGAEGTTFDALLVETRLGSFTAILYHNETPLSVDFMRKLVGAGYYDGREFGRVIPGFVIQEVDRTGGTTDQRETVPLEAPRNVSFSAGAIGIARDADPDSGGSEFFVMDFATSRLYGNYTAFAQVVEGLDVVHKIARVQAVKTGPAGLVASPPGSPVYFGVHDRIPVDPVEMRVSLVRVTLPYEEASLYPLMVGESTATPTTRATMEWPANLRAGAASSLSWYVSPRDTSPQGQARDPPELDLDGAVARVGNETLATTQDPDARGHVRFVWTPPAPGWYPFTLELDGGLVATGNVTVPR